MNNVVPEIKRTDKASRKEKSMFIFACISLLLMIIYCIFFVATVSALLEMINNEPSPQGAVIGAFLFVIMVLVGFVVAMVLCVLCIISLSFSSKLISRKGQIPRWLYVSSFLMVILFSTAISLCVYYALFIFACLLILLPIW